jgi:hypothetical protein
VTVFDKIIDYVSKGGVITVLLGILLAGQQGIWVWGTTLTKAETERDTWKQLALQGSRLAEEAATRPTRVIGMAPPLSVSASQVKPLDISDRLSQLEEAMGRAAQD